MNIFNWKEIKKFYAVYILLVGAIAFSPILGPISVVYADTASTTDEVIIEEEVVVEEETIEEEETEDIATSTEEEVFEDENATTTEEVEGNEGEGNLLTSFVSLFVVEEDNEPVYIQVSDKSGNYYDVFCPEEKVVVGVNYNDKGDDHVEGIWCDDIDSNLGELYSVKVSDLSGDYYNRFCQDNGVVVGVNYDDHSDDHIERIWCRQTELDLTNRERVQVSDLKGDVYDRFCPEGKVVVGVNYDDNSDDHIEKLFCEGVEVVEEPTECNDNQDNDGDGKIDLEDPGCEDANDDDESNEPVAQCADGEDNDGDGLTDLQDPGCENADDDDETNEPASQCEDGLDNDGDGKIDLEDPGCENGDDDDETDNSNETQCSDGIDNDGDGLSDLNDPGCENSEDDSEDNENGPECDDGIDNDGDGKIDYRTDGEGDPHCTSPSDDKEAEDTVPNQCEDGQDNDGDGLVDLQDPGCENGDDNDETNGGDETQCSDGTDNDGDGLIDLQDPGCENGDDNDESNDPLVCSEVITPAGNDTNLFVEKGANESEKNLKQLLVDAGYNVSTSTSQVGFETWQIDNNAKATFEVTLVGKESAAKSVFGSYDAGNSNSFDPVFKTGTITGFASTPEFDINDDALVSFEDGEEFGFAVKSYVSGDLLSFRLTESDLNNGGTDKVVVLQLNDGYAIAFEDGSDNDYNDLVVLLRPISCEDITPQPEIDLDVNKVASVATTTVGSNFSYTITVSNIGPETAGGVSVLDTLPASVSFVSGTASKGTYATSTGIWTVGSMNASTTETLILNVKAESAGVISNTASASATNGSDDNSENNSDTVVVSSQNPVVTECNDGLDNDGDGLSDMNDPGCESPEDDSEKNPNGPQCDDGIDNDGDGKIDYRTDGEGDPHCSSPSDNQEAEDTTSPQCSDGLDNDGDGLIDYPADSGCENAQDDSENNGGGGGGGDDPACSDGLDNDGDGLSDMNDPGCESPEDDSEKNPNGPQCDDGEDNDDDGDIDYLENGDGDRECSSPSDDSESGDGGGGGGSSGSRPKTSGQVLGATIEACPIYLTKYIKLGASNDPVEVSKLQKFLRDFEGFSHVKDTGFYDLDTYEAVKAFQERYGQDVLGPWGIGESTGYVFITTTLAINNIYCQRTTANDLDLRNFYGTNSGVVTDNTRGIALGEFIDFSSTTTDATTTNSTTTISDKSPIGQAAGLTFLGFIDNYPWWWWIVVLILLIVLVWSAYEEYMENEEDLIENTDESNKDQNQIPFILVSDKEKEKEKEENK